jgi:ATP-dependent Clp protease ATP-binding subunit ClpA
MSGDTGKMPTYNSWADDAVRVVARTAMQRTGHRIIGTPHLLIGVMKSGVAANMLQRRFGITAVAVIPAVCEMKKPVPQGIGEEFLYSEGAQSTLDAAAELSRKYPLKHDMVYTTHLLAALLEVNDEELAHVLGELGVDRDEILAEVMKSLQDKSGRVKS